MDDNYERHRAAYASAPERGAALVGGAGGLHDSLIQLRLAGQAGDPRFSAGV